MSKILKFEDFVNEGHKKIEVKVETLVTVDFWNGLFSSSYLLESEKNLLKSIKDVKFTSLNESLLVDINKKMESMKDVKLDLKRDTLKKLEVALKGAKTFASFIATYFKKIFDKILGFYVKKFNDVRKMMIENFKKDNSIFKTKDPNFKIEVTNLKEISKYWLKEFPAEIYKLIEKSYPKELINESFDNNFNIMLNILNESEVEKKEDLLPFLKVISSKLETSEKFSYLKSIDSVGKTGTIHFLNNFSAVTKEMGGPGIYEFVLLSGVSGFFYDYSIKTGISSLESEILKNEGLFNFVPMASQIIKSIMYTALIVTLLDTISQLNNVENKK